MATILPFSSIINHVKQLKDSSKKALLDTNILISFSHDTNIFHDDTLEAFGLLKKENFKIYSNVTTRSEFIDYQRRIIITEALAWYGSKIEGILSYKEIAKKLKAHQNNVRKRADNNNPLVINDSTIKQFKKLLSFPHRNIKNLWLEFCTDNLYGRLEKTFSLTSNVMNLHYLSLRKEDSSPEITKNVKWNKMYKISEKSGLSINDSMILNLFECSDIPFLFTTDFDLIYAAAISPVYKTVFCPDSLYQNYKDNFFHIL